MLLVLICNSTLIFAQVKFEKTIGGAGYDYGYSVTQTFDKGYAIAGSTTSFGYGNSDAYLIKTDSNGVQLFSRTFGGINVDQAYSIKQTKDSGLVIAGYTNSFGSGGYDMYVVKTNKNGDTLWTKTYGGADWDFAYSIDQTKDGGYIIAGGTYSFGKGDEDVYLVKTDSIGDTLWTKTFGGIYEDEARSVKQTSDSGYIICGHTKSYGAGNADIYYIKTNKFGDTIWTKTLGSIGDDGGTSIIQKMDGGYALSGYVYDSTHLYYQAYTVNMDINGDTLWTIKNGVPNNAVSNSIIQSNDGGLVWAGQLNINGEDFYIFKYFLNTNYGFSTTFGYNTMVEEAYSIQQTADKGYIIVGTTNGPGFGLNDVLLVKTDSTGFSTGSIVIDVKEIQKETSGINVFPNPVSNISSINIKLSERGNSPVYLTIYDEMGKIVFANKNKLLLTNNEVNIPLNGKEFNSGIYFIQVSANDNIYSKKFIVQH